MSATFASPRQMPAMHMRRKRLERHRPSHFVRLLWKMLEEGHDDLIRWTSDGLRFKILDHERLAAEVLPHFFAHSNFSSFQRQLNYFGFRRCQRTRPMVYVHVHFQRDQPELMSLIIRSTNKKCVQMSIRNESTSEKFIQMSIRDTSIRDEESNSTQRLLQDYRAMTGKLARLNTHGAKNGKIAKQKRSRYLSIKELTTPDVQNIPPSNSLFILADLATSTPLASTEGGGVRNSFSSAKSCSDHLPPLSSSVANVGTGIGIQLSPNTTLTDLHRAPKRFFKPSPADEGGSLSLEETVQSLPETCVVRDPSNFQKFSAMDSHGVRFKDPDSDKWRWKCRHCQQVLVVGHGAPNAHLKTVHGDIFSSPNSLNWPCPAAKPESNGSVTLLTPPAKRKRGTGGEEDPSLLAEGAHLPSTRTAGIAEETVCGSKGPEKPMSELWDLLESIRPKALKKQTRTQSKLSRLLESTKPSRVPLVSTT